MGSKHWGAGFPGEVLDIPNRHKLMTMSAAKKKENNGDRGTAAAAAAAQLAPQSPRELKEAPPDGGVQSNR